MLCDGVPLSLVYGLTHDDLGDDDEAYGHHIAPQIAVCNDPREETETNI
jgi:hypothetical protein